MTRPWEALLEQLVAERWGRLVGHATLVAASPDDARDLVQEALLATFGSRARFGSLAEAEQYVRRAIVSRSVDDHRRRNRERAVLLRYSGDGTPVATDAPTRLGSDAVRALAGLAPRERACVVLRHVDDLSVRETASVLGLSEGAVKRYTADGLARLAPALAPGADQVERVPVRPIVRPSRTEVGSGE